MHNTCVINLCAHVHFICIFSMLVYMKGAITVLTQCQCIYQIKINYFTDFVHRGRPETFLSMINLMTGMSHSQCANEISVRNHFRK